MNERNHKEGVNVNKSKNINKVEKISKINVLKVALDYLCQSFTYAYTYTHTFLLCFYCEYIYIT